MRDRKPRRPSYTSDKTRSRRARLRALGRRLDRRNKEITVNVNIDGRLVAEAVSRRMGGS